MITNLKKRQTIYYIDVWLLKGCFVHTDTNTCILKIHLKFSLPIKFYRF